MREYHARSKRSPNRGGIFGGPSKNHDHPLFVTAHKAVSIQLEGVTPPENVSHRRRRTFSVRIEDVSVDISSHSN